MSASDVIKIGIAGTPDSNSRVEPLMSIGWPESDLRNSKNYPSWVKSDSLIEFVQKPDCTVLTYIARPGSVHPFSSSAAGCFWVSLAVPKGKRIKGYTPYRLLIEVVDIFRDNFMSRKGSGVYEFNNVSVYTRQPVVDFINDLEVCDTETRYITMDGKVPAYVNAGSLQNMRLFFNDPQYWEFNSYEKVLIAESIEGDVLDITIPRHADYDVYYMDEHLGVINSEDQVFSRKFPAPDEYHQARKLEFTLANYPENEVNVIHEEKKVIITPKFKEKIITFQFLLDNSEALSLDVSAFRIIIGGKQVKIWDKAGNWTFQVSGDAVARGLSPEIELEDKDLYVSRVDVLNDQKQVKVELLPYVKSILVEFAEPLEEPAELEILFEDGEHCYYPLRKDCDRFSFPVNNRRHGENIIKLRITSSRCFYVVKLVDHYASSSFVVNVESKPRIEVIKHRIQELKNNTLTELSLLSQRIKEAVLSYRERPLALGTVVLAILIMVGGVVWWPNYKSAFDLYRQKADNCLNVVSKIEAKSQSKQLFTLKDWDDLVSKYQEALIKLDSSAIYIDSCKLEINNTKSKKHRESYTHELSTLEKKQSELEAGNEALKSTINGEIDKQINHFWNLMTTFENDGYVLTFTDPVAIKDWLNKMEEAGLLGSDASHYEDVKKFIGYFEIAGSQMAKISWKRYDASKSMLKSPERDSLRLVHDPLYREYTKRNLACPVYKFQRLVRAYVISKSVFSSSRMDLTDKDNKFKLALEHPLGSFKEAYEIVYSK